MFKSEHPHPCSVGAPHPGPCSREEGEKDGLLSMELDKFDHHKSVLGSRKNVVTSSLSPLRATSTGCMRCGWGASMVMRWWRVVARLGWSAGHSPERRWATSPGTRPQPGRRQAPDSCVQCLLSQHILLVECLLCYCFLY